MMQPFLLTALGVGLLSAALCAYVGNFVLMKDMTFIAVALSEIAALGVALGLLWGMNPDLAALAATLIGVIFFWRRRDGATTAEGMIGLIYVTCAAAMLIVVALNPRLEAHGVDLLGGNLLYSTTGDLKLLAGFGLAIAVVHGVFRPRFLLVSFDAETARTLGVRARAWELALLLTIGAVIALCLKLTGMLFVFASLIVPGLTALAICRRVGPVFVVSVAVALVCVVAGTALSFLRDLPTSPTIICCYAAAFVLATILRRDVSRR